MEYAPRKFNSEEEIRIIGEGLLDRSLPKTLWTHEAHFAAVVYLLIQKPEIDLETQLPKIIFQYNEASGGMNTDTGGYHETLTQFYIKLIRSFISRFQPTIKLLDLCNNLVTSPESQLSIKIVFKEHAFFSASAKRMG